MQAGSDPVSSPRLNPQPPASTTQPEIDPETAASMREYALQQLVRAAREMALARMERSAHIINGHTHPVCEHCRARLVDKDDIWNHRPECPVGAALAAIRTLGTYAPEPKPRTANLNRLRGVDALFHGLSTGSDAVAALRAEMSGEEASCALPGCAHGNPGGAA